MTRDHVIRAAEAIGRPGPIRAWSCLIELGGERREFPVKQLFMEAANQVACSAPLVTPADFIPHFAQARLKRLGFEIRYVAAGRTAARWETHTDSADTEAVSSANAMVVPEQIANFIRDGAGRAFCDDCVQQMLDLKQRQTVQPITSALGLTSDFRRARGACSACGRHDKLVTEAVQR
jgi:hypothetical protein